MDAHPDQPISVAAHPLVLVVDDSVDVIRLIALVLRGAYEVIFATSGPVALELAHKRLPQVILLDLEMPGMSGIDVAKALRESAVTQGIPVMFVSADDPRTWSAVGLPSQGADLSDIGWIRKPFSARDVNDAISGLLARGNTP